jgi:hypothetical protein
VGGATLPPGFFVSVDSKGDHFRVRPLE